MYSVTQFAEATGLTRRAILKRIQKGQLKAEKIGNTYVIHEEPVKK